MGRSLFSWAAHWRNSPWQSDVWRTRGLVLTVGIIGQIDNNDTLYLHPLCFCSCLSQLFGCGSVAQTVLSKGALGEPLTIHVGFTLGVMMAVYMAGGVSGTNSPQTHSHSAHFTLLLTISHYQLICKWFSSLVNYVIKIDTCLFFKDHQI